jgi:hypothetical protein
MRIDPSEVVIADRINPDEVEIAQPTAGPRQSLALAQTMREQTAPIGKQLEVGIANATTRLAHGVGQLLPNTIAKYFPTQQDVDLLEAATEGRPIARTAQIGTDVAASLLPATKAAQLARAAPLRARAAAVLASEAGANAGYGALTADEGHGAEGAAWGAGGTAAGHVLGRALGAVRQGAKPTEEALRYQDLMRGGNVLAGDPPPPVLTAGQLAPADGWLRKGESMMAHMPFAGAPLRARQEEAMRGFRATTRAEAMPPTQAIAGMEGYNLDTKTIAGLKQGFNDAYDAVLGGVNIPVGVNSIDNSLVTKPARELQKAEAEMKSEAARLMRSNDLATINEGKRLMAEAKSMGESWRSKLPKDVEMSLRGIDGQYAAFKPLENVSKKAASTLLTPEAYSPKDLLKALRNKPGQGAARQRDITELAEGFVGSTNPTTTLGGNLGALGTAIGVTTGHVPLLVPAAIAGYGTKTGQKVARGLQRTLTADEVAVVANALRRGATPATLAATRDDE